MASARSTVARTGRAFLILALVAASVVVTGARPAHAITTPVPGAPCGTDDLGRRAPKVATIVKTPVVTHFMSINVTVGSNTEYTYTLEVTNTVTTEISENFSVSTNWTIAAGFSIGASAGFTVRDVNTHTETTRTTMLWRFVNPGYYALYQGVLKVSGTLQGYQCTAVTQPDGTQPLQWVLRTAGTYVTFGAPEQGSVRCEDLYPAGTLRLAAQTQLCAVLAAKKATAATPVAATGDRRGNHGGTGGGTPAAVTPAVVPPEFTCDTTHNYDIVTSNRQWLVASGWLGVATLRALTSTGYRDWYLCKTAAADPDYLIVLRQAPLCLDIFQTSIADAAIITSRDLHLRDEPALPHLPRHRFAHGDRYPVGPEWIDAGTGQRRAGGGFGHPAVQHRARRQHRHVLPDPDPVTGG